METRAEPDPLVRRFRATGRALQRLPRPAAAALAVAWAGVIWSLSSLPPRAVPGAGLWSGLLTNTAHAPAFGMLAFLALLALPRAGGWPRTGRRETNAVLLAVAAYGVVDELHQALTPGRDASVCDLATDVVGAAAVVWIVRYLADARARQASGAAPAELAAGDRASGRGLVARLALGLLACVAAGAAATVVPRLVPDLAFAAAARRPGSAPAAVAASAPTGTATATSTAADRAGERRRAAARRGAISAAACRTAAARSGA